MIMQSLNKPEAPLNPRDTSEEYDQTIYNKKEIAYTYVYGYTITLALGGLQLGFLLSYSDEIYNGSIPLSTDSGIFCASIIGGLLSASSLVNSGRRKTLLQGNNVLIVSSLISLAGILISLKGTGLSTDLCVALCLIGRIGQGFSSGLYTMIVPLSVREISPREIRGKMGTIYELLLRIGVMIFVLFEIINNNQFDINVHRSLLLAFPIAVACIQSILLMTKYKYETPKFYMLSNKYGSCEKTLIYVYENAHRTAAALKELHDAKEDESLHNMNWKKIFTLHLHALLVGCGVAFFSAMTGETSLAVILPTQLYTGTSNIKGIFNSLKDYKILLEIIISGVSGVLGCLMAFLVGEKIGRRIIMIVGSIMITIFSSLFILFYSYEMHPVLIVGILSFYVLFFCFTYAPILWGYPFEILHPKGVTFSFIVYFACLFITSEMMRNSIEVCFGIFTCLTFLSVIFGILFLRETKNLNESQLKYLYFPEPKTEKVCIQLNSYVTYLQESTSDIQSLV